GEGNLRWHRVRITDQGSEKGVFWLASPRSERERDQGEGRFRLHTYAFRRLVGQTATARNRPKLRPALARSPPLAVSSRAPFRQCLQIKTLLPFPLRPVSVK